MSEEAAFTLSLVTAYSLAKVGFLMAATVWRNHHLEFDFPLEAVFVRLGERFSGHAPASH